MTFLNLLVYAVLFGLGWIAADIYWTSIRTDDDAADHFCRDQAKGHFKAYFGLLKVLAFVVLFLLVVLMLSGCSAVDKAVETLDKPIAGANASILPPTSESTPALRAEDPSSASTVDEMTNNPVTPTPAPVTVANFDCDAAVVSNLDNPKVDPTVKIPAGNGVVISTDPGVVLVGEKKLVASDKGMLIGYYNDATSEVTATVKTGWNSPNGRWNTYICRFALDKEQVWDRANEKQAKEKKPVFKLFTRSETVTDKVVEQPTTSPSGSTATSCDSTGAWKGDLDVPAMCVVWISMDPGSGEVNDVKFTFDKRATLVVYGPAKVKLGSPPIPNVNHWMGLADVVDTKARDGAPIAKQWNPGLTQLIDR